ncbi:unnamed protein product [Moneuplotes crassus]|uniref:Cytochrome b5 heme-binding domain-containing protein n=1 Tax=Euplotes crassus TaxID=5936 RepID=A0AAD1Y2K5_EUPCR|nr:unnamed protein product [Moneuplotes crassus]
MVHFLTDNFKILFGCGLLFLSFILYYLYFRKSFAKKRQEGFSIIKARAKSDPFSGFPAPKVVDPKEYVYLTKNELAEYNGKNEKTYIGVKYDIFDVTDNQPMYGPSGSYHFFAGKETTIAMARNSTKTEDIELDFYDVKFTSDEEEALESWYNFFKSKYPLVGKVVRGKET